MATALTFLAATDLSAQCPDGTPPPCQAQTARAASTPAPNSLAVLHFDNLSPDTADAYLADGLTEEIILRLGQIERLAVKSRTAARRSLGDPATMGRALGVAYLVSGSVRRGGERVRVTVELVRAANGLRVWGDAFDRGSMDVLSIEEEIARAVATAIAGRLAPPERASLAARPTHSPAAYDHFLRGNYALAQRSEAGLARAIAEYQTALQLDPTFTSALSRTAYAYALSLGFGWTVPGLPAESLLAGGMALADRALGQDSASSDAWMARGFMLTLRNPMTFLGVREAFERSIALNAKNAEAQHQFGTALFWLGDDAAAETAFRRALALDPARPVTLRSMAQLRLLQHAYVEALRWADSTVAVDSTFMLAYLERARVRRVLGDTAGARRDADAAQRFATSGMRPWAEVTRVFAEAAAGDTVAARARADRLFETKVSGDSTGSDLGFRDGGYVAMALAVAGEEDRALSTLEHARRWGLMLAGFFRSPEFDVIRDQPRFKRLVEELGPRRLVGQGKGKL